jgi:DNA gyrase subunit A
MGIMEILKEWIIFRVDCIKKQTLFDIEKKSDKLHLLLGLKKILLDIDKAISIIRNTEQEALVVPNLMKGFDIDQVQAEFIAEIKLRNLNREYILNRISEIENLQKEIADLKDLYSSEKKIKKVIIKQLEYVSKKYGQPRCTEIIHEEQVEEVTSDHLIEDYNLKLFLTKQNYLKKIPLTSLRNSPDHKLKDDDFIMQEIETRNKAELLLFSNRHTVYKLRIFEIDDCKASSLGEYLANLLGMEDGEEIIYMAATDDYKGYMIFAYENGKVAKIDLSSYATKTNRKKLSNAYCGLCGLVYISHIIEDEELVAFSSLKKVLIFNTGRINSKSTRDSQGVQVLKSKKGSIMTQVKRINEVSFKDLDYYRTKNIPAIGCYLKGEDTEDGQVKFEL